MPNAAIRSHFPSVNTNTNNVGGLGLVPSCLQNFANNRLLQLIDPGRTILLSLLVM